MTRIFATLAGANAVSLIVSFALGLAFMWQRDAGVMAPRGDQPLDGGAFTWHMVIGLFTAVLTLMVHCLIFTYFLGTGRWVKEVARAYALPDEPWPKRTRELKRQTFPPALFAMLAVIFTVATGAAAQTSSESWSALAHPILAVVTLAINGWAYVVEYRSVAVNARVVRQVQEAADRKRTEAEAAALASRSN